MAHLPGHLLVALSVTLVVGAAAGGGWAMFVMGAVLALSLWVMLVAGSFATGDPAGRGRTSVRAYAVAAVAAVALGWVMSRIGDGPSWWAVGFILAGAVVPPVTAGVRSSGDGA